MNTYLCPRMIHVVDISFFFSLIEQLHYKISSFAWLELVSHRSFMPKMLTVNGQKGWPYVQRLLVDLLQFLEPFLRNAELGGPVCTFFPRVIFALNIRDIIDGNFKVVFINYPG